MGGDSDYNAVIDIGTASARTQQRPSPVGRDRSRASRWGST